MREKKRPNMWAILLKIGVNTNAKPGDCRPYDMEDEYRYHEELFFDKEVWHKVTEYLPTQGINTVVIDINEGVKLDSHPELAVPGSLEKAEFIEELKRLRSLGLTPIPKFNFSSAHNAWLQTYAYQVGMPIYRQVCEDIVRETIEIFEYPAFFHLGFNSEDAKYLYIPKGFAHGFKALKDHTVMLYAVSSGYDKCSDSGILWNTINYDWNVKEPIVSERDKNFISFTDFVSPF